MLWPGERRRRSITFRLHLRRWPAGIYKGKKIGWSRGVRLRLQFLTLTEVYWVTTWRNLQESLQIYHLLYEKLLFHLRAFSRARLKTDLNKTAMVICCQRKQQHGGSDVTSWMWMDLLESAWTLLEQNPTTSGDHLISIMDDSSILRRRGLQVRTSRPLESWAEVKGRSRGTGIGVVDQVKG